MLLAIIDKNVNATLKGIFTEWLFLLATCHIGHLADEIENIAEPFYDEGPLLHVAAEYGLTEVVDRLSQKVPYYDSSPSLQPPDSDGDAVQKKQSTFYEPGKEDISPILHTACQWRSPNLKMLKLLVQNCNIDVNARSREHQYRYSSDESSYGDLESTGLHWLASADSFWQLEGIQYLVEKGADINATNEKGQTPLYIAAVGYVFAEFLPSTLMVKWCSLLNSAPCRLTRSLRVVYYRRTVKWLCSLETPTVTQNR